MEKEAPVQIESQSAILFVQKDATIKGRRGISMKTGDILQSLMAFIYDKYNASDVFESHGEHASVILTRFTRESGIRLGDTGTQLEYMRLLLRLGWIDIVTSYD